MEKLLYRVGPVDLRRLIKVRRDRLQAGNVVDDVYPHPSPERQQDQDKVARVGKHQPVFRRPPEEGQHPVGRCRRQRAEGKPENDTDHDDGSQRGDKENRFEKGRKFHAAGVENHRKNQRNDRQHHNVPESIAEGGGKSLFEVAVPHLLIIFRADPLHAAWSVNFLEAHQNCADEGIEIDHEKKDQKRRDEHVGYNLRIREPALLLQGRPGRLIHGIASMYR